MSFVKRAKLLGVNLKGEILIIRRIFETFSDNFKIIIILQILLKTHQ